MTLRSCHQTETNMTIVYLVSIWPPYHCLITTGGIFLTVLYLQSSWNNTADRQRNSIALENQHKCLIWPVIHRVAAATTFPVTSPLFYFSPFKGFWTPTQIEWFFMRHLGCHNIGREYWGTLSLCPFLSKCNTVERMRWKSWKALGELEICYCWHKWKYQKLRNNVSWNEKWHEFWHATRAWQVCRSEIGEQMVSAKLCIMCVKVIKVYCQFPWSNRSGE